MSNTDFQQCGTMIASREMQLKAHEISNRYGGGAFAYYSALSALLCATEGCAQLAELHNAPDAHNAILNQAYLK